MSIVVGVQRVDTGVCDDIGALLPSVAAMASRTIALTGGIDASVVVDGMSMMGGGRRLCSDLETDSGRAL